jgi:peptidoglycan/xylan/chitin deacetylase (PgdA/CDA1 family)
MTPDAGTVAILMYHSFAPAATSEFHGLSIPPQLLDEHLRALRESGFRLITVRDVPAALLTMRPGDRIAAVTIDDGLGDGLAAAEILGAQGVPATYFIPTAFVGGTARWLGGVEAQRAMMDWPDIVGLARAGMEVGSHGHGHIAADLNDRSVVRDDAQRSRDALEQSLGVAVSSYAYPFGYQGRAARRAVALAGFARACAIFGLPSCRSDDVYALPRLHVGPDMSGEDVVTLCLRRWRPLARFEAHQRQRAWTTARRIVPLGPRSSQRVRAGNPDSSIGDSSLSVDRIA